MTFWIHESFDRFIRDEEHFIDEIIYIEQNPVKAGLCQSAEDWPWSSVHYDFNRMVGFHPATDIITRPSSAPAGRRRATQRGERNY